MSPKTAKSPARNTSVYSMLQIRESEGRPIRVGVVGAGATGRAIALQLGTPVPGIRLAGMANRTPGGFR
jgi:predicted homoserine dehydrogenase-like protein